jgi:large subunit ribosomal protein L10
MSKYVKNLITEDLRHRLNGVEDALLVNMVGLDANTNNRIRRALEDKKINVVVVKNSLASRAVEGTSLAPMFEGMAGTAAICYGAEDVVSLAKEVVRLAKDKKFAPFSPAGGVMDGEKLSAEQVEAVSRWPSRSEQLSLLVGQLLGPGSQLSAQLLGPGGAVASQIKQKSEPAEGEEEAAPAAAE